MLPAVLLSFVLLIAVCATNYLHETPTCSARGCRVAIAILISERAGENNFTKVKRFVQDNINNCMNKPKDKPPSAVYIFYPNRAEQNGLDAWCSSQNCIDDTISHITYENNSVPISSQLSKNDKETLLAARTSILLLQNGTRTINRIVDEDSSDEEDDLSIFVIISDYVSEQFALTYDHDKEFRKNLSRIQFLINVVQARADYYIDKSSIPTANLFRFSSFDALDGKDDRLCPPSEKDEDSDKTGIEIAAICVSSVVLLISLIGFGTFFYVRRKRRRQRLEQPSAFIGRSVSQTISDFLANEKDETDMYYVDRSGENK
uniref:Uncharacterized protein n=1 Tax=Plectus sambesii TaxID=2011161 RepID=A0A914VX58_9BILA